MRYRSANTTTCSARYRLLWRPKYRRRVLIGGGSAPLKEIIADVAGEVGAEVIEVEMMPHHVHMLAEVPPTVPLWRFLGLVKGRSSRQLCMEFPRLRGLPALWSLSWFVSTVGGAPSALVGRYAANQQVVSRR